MGKSKTALSAAPATRLSFAGDLLSAKDADTTIVIGKKEALKSLDLNGVTGLSLEPATVTAMLDSMDDEESGSVSTFVQAHRLSLCSIPSEVSRNLHPLSPHTVTDLVSGAPKGNRTLVFFAGLEKPSASVGLLASAVSKAFPLYSQKTSSKSDKNAEAAEKEVCVSFLDMQGSVLSDPDSLKVAEAVSEGVRLAARLVDMTPAELSTDVYAQECWDIADELGDCVTITEIVGEELDKRGYGGLYGVGKAATSPPRLIIFEYVPRNPNGETVALVGKGIIYDTGGLSLKPRTGMCGMKHDVGGSAGLLGGFYAAVKLATPQRMTLLLCLAENAIGPAAFRNDDILTLYSGKTVEVNNCDAEGRLVLGDGVAHATKHIEGLTLVVDMATLTGAQSVTTGKKHAGVLANTAELEERAVQAGLRSGDYVFPLLYAPELLKSEFKSKVADMKNSVKDRSNAQASCAGHFIESHLAADYKGGWLHIDMAGPV
jgi:probable aminopeptidase NPEPL1